MLALNTVEVHGIRDLARRVSWIRRHLLVDQPRQGDPTGFVADLTTPVVIDEVQRAPDLLLAVKQRVDEDQRAGQFLLTGSANILTAPTIADTLTGRAEYHRLWPFTQGELRGVRETFIASLFRGQFPQVTRAEVGRKAHAC